MRITENTKYIEIAAIEKYFSKKTIEELKSAAVERFGSMYDLEFATFWNCANGDFSHLGNLDDLTVLQAYWMKKFEDFADEFAKTLSTLQVKSTEDEKRASDGLIKVTWGESILVFIQKYFGLKSFKEAEKITIGELLIAKRAQYNDDLFQRKLARIRTQKFGHKK